MSRNERDQVPHMNFQQLCDSMSAMTCVVSVEAREGGYGKIRIVAGNKAYIDSIENPAAGTEMLKDKFVPNSEYTDYFTQDLNFEDFCYRAAVQKKCLHSYAHPDRMPVWFNMTFLPVEADDGDLRYCTYTMEIDFKPDTHRMSNISEDLAADVLATSLKLRDVEDFDAAIGDVIGDVRELCEAEYCCILLVDEQERTCSVLCEDAAEGSRLASMEDYIGEGFYELVESWPDTIAGSNCLIAKNDHDMEVVRRRNPEWHRSLTDAGTENIVLFPLKSRGNLLGYIWALNFDAQDAGRIKETLELATFILASEISNSMLLDRLRTLSSRDMLTGVCNRNEMNNVVAELWAKMEHGGIPIGIVYADLNGLKQVNDAGGHDAGDALLREAAWALTEVFEPERIYRAGGDEFVVIETGISEDSFSSKVAALGEAVAGYGDVSFALGTFHDPCCRDIYEALRTADRRMYADKRAYYEKHPDRNRHKAGVLR